MCGQRTPHAHIVIVWKLFKTSRIVSSCTPEIEELLLSLQTLAPQDSIHAVVPHEESAEGAQDTCRIYVPTCFPLQHSPVIRYSIYQAGLEIAL
jgi:hypothetical protein